MRVGPHKIWVVAEWPSISLNTSGDSSGSRRFIKDNDKVSTVLTHLTSPKSPFQWSDLTGAVFDDLQGGFLHPHYSCRQTWSDSSSPRWMPRTRRSAWFFPDVLNQLGNSLDGPQKSVLRSDSLVFQLSLGMVGSVFW